MKKTYTKPVIMIHILTEDLMNTFLPIGSNGYDGELVKKHTIIIDDDEEDLKAATIMNEYGFDKPIPDQLIW